MHASLKDRSVRPFMPALGGVEYVVDRPLTQEEKETAILVSLILGWAQGIQGDFRANLKPKSMLLNRADAMVDVANKLLVDSGMMYRMEKVDCDQAAKLFDEIEVLVKKSIAEPKPLPVRGPDGRMRRAEVAA